MFVTWSRGNVNTCCQMNHVRDDLNLGKGLHIAHLNVRSLIGGHKFDTLRYQIRTCGIQVFTISESWLSKAIPDKTIEIVGFNLVRADRSWNEGGGGVTQEPKRGGGLVCYVKNGIKYSDSKLKHLNASCLVYKATILPIIDYNDFFQLLWNTNKTKKLQKLQNWGLRIVYSDRHPKLGEDDMHAEANVPLLKLRRIEHLLELMYRRSKEPDRLDDRKLPTRQFDKIKFKVDAPQVRVSFKSPNYLGSIVWDKLPLETQSSPDIANFKKRIKRHAREGLFKNLM